MVSAIEVYTTLKDLANKEQKGLSPLMCSIRLPVSLKETLSTRCLMSLRATKERLGWSRPPEKIVLSVPEEDVGRYIKSSSVSVSDGTGDIPSDCRKIINIKSGTTVVAWSTMWTQWTTSTQVLCLRLRLPFLQRL